TGGVFAYNVEVLPPPVGAEGEGQKAVAQPSGVPSPRVNVHQEDMGGWVRAFSDRVGHQPDQLPLFLSHGRTEFFRRRPQLSVKCVVPVVRDGATVELHAWYTLHVFPDAFQQTRPAPQPPAPG